LANKRRKVGRTPDYVNYEVDVRFAGPSVALSVITVPQV